MKTSGRMRSCKCEPLSFPANLPNMIRYDPSRWLDGKEQSAAAKSTFCAFGAGAYSCLGINLAWMELRYATAFLFRECRGMRIAPSMSADCMDLENYFVIVPKGHTCEVTLQ